MDYKSLLLSNGKSQFSQDFKVFTNFIIIFIYLLMAGDPQDVLTNVIQVFKKDMWLDVIHVFHLSHMIVLIIVCLTVLPSFI